MTNDNASLLDRAESIAAKAHVPYSRFRVGAIAVLADGSIHAGCNVENAAYGASVCAEVNAITTAVANGATEIDTVAVVHARRRWLTDRGHSQRPPPHVLRSRGARRLVLVSEP